MMRLSFDCALARINNLITFGVRVCGELIYTFQKQKPYFRIIQKHWGAGGYQILIFFEIILEEYQT